MNKLLKIAASPFLFMLLASDLWAIPATVSISGMLEDEDSSPVLYRDDNGVEIPQVLAAQVEFFTTETGGVKIHDITTTTTAYHGYFSISLTLPENLLVQDNLWYTLAIDANLNGLDGNDQFPDRFQIGSVPFALSAKPVTFFNTHNGYSSSTAGTPQHSCPVVNFSPDAMVVAPYTTPPGGVKFNRMDIYVEDISPNTNCSYGIYDQLGNLVVTSPLIIIKDANFKGYLQVKVPERTLLPSTMYFTAVTNSPNDLDHYLMLRNTLLPSIPLLGVVAIPGQDGNLPQSFALTGIHPELKVVPVTITLSHDDSISTETQPAVKRIPMMK